MKRHANEFEKFDNTMRSLMKVSHAELKAALDAEKAEKKGKSPRRTSTPTNAKRS